MNKIKVVNDNLDCVKVNDAIQIEYYKSECLFGINEVKINAIKDTTLDIEIYIVQENKLNFNINIVDGVTLTLNVYTKGENGKIQYKYNLGTKSVCKCFKYQDVFNIKEMVIAKLKGEYATFQYSLKTISNKKETYDFHIFHEYKNTISNIKNNGVCINSGSIIYQVSTFIPKNVIGCVAKQNNRIINLTNNKSEIKPNLYVDCDDVEASHSALIGKFSDEEMFYLQSRGIDKITAQKLLINGFLTSDINNKRILSLINKNIEKYWR